MEITNTVTILVVEDDDGHRELIRRNLKRGGVLNNIVCVSNGADALDYVFCRGAHSDRRGASELLILLDVNMAGIDGVEVLRQIKADPNRRKIPVIMLTTTDDPREVQKCYELGCNEYVTKPLDPNSFIEAIRRLGMFLSIVSVPEVS
jgi:CheY-like chemotaxis protein